MVASCHTETMLSSCHGTLADNHELLMTQSLDPNMLCNTFNNKSKESGLKDIEGKFYFMSKKIFLIIKLVVN